MKKKGEFSKILAVGSVTIFFLSISLIDMHARELGETPPFGTPHLSYDVPNDSPYQVYIPRVAGYEVNTSIISIAPISDPSTGSGSTTPSSTPDFVFSNISTIGNKNYTTLISWTTNLDARIFGVNWYEEGSSEMFWHWLGSEHVPSSKNHSIQLGDEVSWHL